MYSILSLCICWPTTGQAWCWVLQSQAQEAPHTNETRYQWGRLRHTTENPKQRGQRGGSAGKDSYYQIWWPEFRPWDPHGKRIETTPQSCTLTSNGYSDLTKCNFKKKKKKKQITENLMCNKHSSHFLNGRFSLAFRFFWQNSSTHIQFISHDEVCVSILFSQAKTQGQN